MGGGVDTQGLPADDAQAGTAECGSKAFGVGDALRCGIATADNGNGAAREKRALALEIQQRRRVRRIEQGARVVRISERDNMVFC